MSPPTSIEVTSDSKGIHCLICLDLEIYPIFDASGEQVGTIDCPHCHKPGFNKTINAQAHR